MINLLFQFNQSKGYLTQLIKNQSLPGQFIDWETWFDQVFNPAFEQYEALYQKIRQASNLQKPAYINFKIIATNAMTDDCYDTLE
jgi:hypothetical protein